LGAGVLCSTYEKKGEREKKKKQGDLNIKQSLFFLLFLLTLSGDEAQTLTRG
jgi:hypothetical protein